MDSRDGFPRIGAVSFTNSLPLTRHLGEVFPGASIQLMVPSKLGAELRAGRLDAALLSSIELARNPDYGFAPGAAVCSNGPVRSVCVFTRAQPREVRRIALDANSLTSVVLVKILFSALWDVRPEFVPYTPPVERGLAIADAALAIGDACLEVNREGLQCLDLGELWTSWTGLPFVFALWITRPGLDPQTPAGGFVEARDRGLAEIPKLAEICSQRVNLPPAVFREYFTQNLRYTLGPMELEGMRKFFTLAKPYLGGEG